MEELQGGINAECIMSQIAVAGASWGWFAAVAAMTPVGLVGAGIALAAAGFASGYYCN